MTVYVSILVFLALLFLFGLVIFCGMTLGALLIGFIVATVEWCRETYKTWRHA